MLYYRIEGFARDPDWAERNEDRRVRLDNTRRIAARSESFDRRFKGKTFFYVQDAEEDALSAGIISRAPVDLDALVPAFWKAVGLEVRGVRTEEITLSAAKRMLCEACRHGYIRDDDEVLEDFELDEIAAGHCLEYGEDLIDEVDRQTLRRRAEGLFMRDAVCAELERICAGKRLRGAQGHPVHYLLQTDERDVRKQTCRLLLQALLANGRLSSRRYAYLDFRPGDSFSAKVLDCLYKSSFGGAVVIRYLANDDREEGEHASCDRDTVEKICEVMKRYRGQVLTVFCLPLQCERTKAIFYEELGATALVELREPDASGEQARQYLAVLARQAGIRTDRDLFGRLSEDAGYGAQELREIFDEWHGAKLRTRVYPQYAALTVARTEAVRNRDRGSAYDELMEMIGLDEAKRVICQALDYFKAQKVFEDMGMARARPAMHMSFTGSPGTAKTTAARLFAAIMKENGLLSRGKLIEVGRGDLVGKYVGWTAPTIQKFFREARGSVLFIDEAYSLVDDRDGSYGDEAINTIVQEMENCREDTVVILAGYPDKMEGLLRKNPGLRSRIAFHVPFADYGTQELLKISELIARKQGLTLDDGAQRKLERLFDAAREEKDFGNGRYARSVIEKARMAQAVRLLHSDPARVSREALASICAADVEEPPAARRAAAAIGFRAS